MTAQAHTRCKDINNGLSFRRRFTEYMGKINVFDPLLHRGKMNRICWNNGHSVLTTDKLAAVHHSNHSPFKSTQFHQAQRIWHDCSTNQNIYSNKNKSNMRKTINLLNAAKYFLRVHISILLNMFSKEYIHWPILSFEAYGKLKSTACGNKHLFWRFQHN